MGVRYTLKCRECGKDWGNIPLSYCQEGLAPLGVDYDLPAIREAVTRDDIAQRAANLWRYAELLPLPEDFRPELAVGGTPNSSCMMPRIQTGAVI